MKKLILILLGLFLLGGCHLQLFPTPEEPHCTPEEQVDSIIYKNFNVDTAEFVLATGEALYLDKYPERLEELIEAYEAINKAVTVGLTYDALFLMVKDKLGTLTYMTVSTYVAKFKGLKLPVKTCDGRLIVGYTAKRRF